MVHEDLEDIGTADKEWYAEARTSRVGWRPAYRHGMTSYRNTLTEEDSMSGKNFYVLNLSSRTVKNVGDNNRHKCLSERRKPASNLVGAVQCQPCWKWFMQEQ